MKKHLAPCLAFLLVMSLCACGAGDSGPTSSGGTSQLTTGVPSNHPDLDSEKEEAYNFDEAPLEPTAFDLLTFDTPSEGLQFEIDYYTREFYTCVGIGTCADEIVVIPSTYKDLPVTKVGGEYAWYSNTMKGLVIPESVCKIGPRTFCGCPNLERVSIPDSVVVIGDEAFKACTSLTRISIPGSVEEIQAEAFSGCTNLSSIILSEGIKHIENKAFSGTGVEKITIPASVEDLDSSFTECPNLKAAKFVEGATSTGWRTFSGCASLSKVSLPNTLIEVCDGTFSGCSALKTVTIPDKVTIVGTGAFSDCTALASIAIPSAVKTIELSAFSGCAALKDVTLAEGLLAINSRAFAGCDSLRNLALPESLTSISQSAFSGSGLETITLPKGIASVEQGAFSYAMSLAEINVAEENQAYTSVDGVLYSKDMTALIAYPYGRPGTRYEIPEGVTEIIGYALDVLALRKIVIPGSLTKLDALSINNSYIESFDVNDTNYVFTSVDGVLFTEDMKTLIAYPGGKAVESYHVPEGVERIGSGALHSRNLKEIGLPNSLIEIGDNAFSRCENLTQLTIPDNVEIIRCYAFCWCESFTSITIPANVKCLESGAFDDCIALKDVYVLNPYMEFYSDVFTYSVPTDNPGLYLSQPIDGLVIHGFPSSTAEAYALENDINFMPIQ